MTGLPPPGPRTTAVLVVLCLATFVAGSAELLTVGLLPLISADLQVTTAAGGTLFSAYALGLAVGGPLLTALSIRLERRTVLVTSMALFSVSVALPALVPQFGFFVASRLAGGALQGVLMAAAFTTATTVVPPQRAGRAISAVMAGFAISTVLGLPAGVLVGSVVGWGGALLMLAGAAAMVTGLFLVVLPTLPADHRSFAGDLRHALSARLLLVLVLSLTLFAAPGAVMAYLMPLLDQVTGLSGPVAGSVLVCFGVAGIAGSIVGGRLADLDAARALVLSAAGLVAAFLALYLCREQAPLAVIAIMAWAVFGSTAPPSIQHRALALSGPGSELAASLPASAASAGIAIGSTISGLAYTTSGLPAVVITGLVIATTALGLALATRRLTPSARQPAVRSSSAAGRMAG